MIGLFYQVLTLVSNPIQSLPLSLKTVLQWGPVEGQDISVINPVPGYFCKSSISFCLEPVSPDHLHSSLGKYKVGHPLGQRADLVPDQSGKNNLFLWDNDWTELQLFF